MKNILWVGGLSVLLLSACSKSEKNSRDVVVPPVNPQPQGTPVIGLSLQGNVTAAQVQWILPKFLEGKFEAGKANTEAALDLDLRVGDAIQSVHVNSGFSVKACDTQKEAQSFVKGVGRAPAENLPESLKTDTDELSSWVAASTSFGGKAYLHKRYKSIGPTGIYRFDVLLANEKAGECVLWNLVLTPSADISAEAIENTAEYVDVVRALTETWKGFDVDFED